VAPGTRSDFVATVEELYRRLQVAAPVHRPDPSELAG